MKTYIKKIYEKVIKKNPGEIEFHQAVKEVLDSLVPVLKINPKYIEHRILERLVEPERQIMFRVPWLDDDGKIQVNRGFRIQFNSAIGPYKGGLRFHPSVNLGIIKFLGFEQIFKNSLTGLAMGGGKGGSDFDPKGKSDTEVMKFCQSYMTELYKYLGVGGNTDVPAGDIGVGAREIGYLFGQYKRITQRHEAILTGRALEWGGSLIRSEATGYGSAFFCREMLKKRGTTLEGKIALVSGSGNVAQYTVEKVTQLGGKVVTLSDGNGTIYDPDGIDKKKLDFVFNLKNVERGRIKEYAKKYKVDYYADEKPWHIKCDLAFPSATQNELNAIDAQLLVKNGCIAVTEGANMPCTADAVNIFLEKKIEFGPGKAANAGGVAVSGLEMAQSSQRLFWTRKKVEKHLEKIMEKIHKAAFDASIKYGDENNLVLGANVAGFIKIAEAMIAQGNV